MNTPLSPSSAIRCLQLQKSYGVGDQKVDIIKGIDMQVDLGELFIIAGPSGCGKTTLISILTGLLKADGGQVWLLDRDIYKLKSEELLSFRRKHVGFVFQDFHLFPYLSSLENVSIPLIINGLKEQDAIDKARGMLVKIGLSKKIHHRAISLSGGEKQRIAIARALVHDPQIIVCDEPSSALDQVTGMRIMEILQELANEKTRAVVVVTHDHRTYRFAHRIAKINNGLIAEIISPQDER